MNSRKPRSKDLWIAVAALVLLLEFALWPESRQYIAKVINIAAVVFAGLCLVGALAWVLKRWREARQPRLIFRDGNDVSVRTDAHAINVTYKTSGHTESILWSDLDTVHVVALDRFPIGRVSYMLHRAGQPIEVPWNAEGAKELLQALQANLAGFDNAAVIESTAMLHGFRRLWQRAAERDARPDAASDVPASLSRG